ncbi:MAG TPA: hypothetical protein VG518_02275 [Solirubrobacterales bacterium]|nr:hypothetical protein [Solirubrobacterales bacterium]
MFNVARKHLRAIATIGVASALVVGGVAAAQSGTQNGSQNGAGAGGHPAGPPPLGPPMKGLTYAEFHVQKNGEEQTIRLDQGKITAVDDTSITLAENDGGSVTISLDDNTEVLAGPGGEATIDDLSTGQLVVVCAPEGSAAKSVMVVPKGGLAKGSQKGGGQMPPPPMGGPPSGSQGGAEG